MHIILLFVGGSGSALKIESISVRPDPIRLPGQVNFDFKGALSRSIENFDLDLRIRADTLLGPIEIPCIDNIGSW